MAVMQADTRDSDHATAQTVRLMCEYIKAAGKDPLVGHTALDAESRGFYKPGLPLGWGIFWWVKHALRFIPHNDLKALVAAYPTKRQVLIYPGVVLRSPNPAGDCSTFSMLIAAMLESLGVSWELVTVAVDPRDPTLYSHVFVRAVLPGEGRLTLDGSHGKYPGWEVPRAHQMRRQIWNSDGEAIEDATAPSSLGEYRGMGDDSSDWTDTSGGTSTTDLTGLFASEGLTVPASSGMDTSGVVIPSGYYSPDGGATIIALPAGAAVAPAQSSANWAAFATAMGKAGMTLAQINAIQPGTVVSANGAILRQSTGLAVPVGGVTATLGANSSTVLLIGGAVAAFVVIMMLSKGR